MDSSNANINYYEDENRGTKELNAKTPEHIWNVIGSELSDGLKGSILEIGSGTGVYYDFLKNSKNLTSIELVDINIKHLLAKGYKSVVKHDLNSYPYPIADESQDFILFSHVLEHLYSPYLALSECRRILKPGGTLLLGVPVSNSFFYNNWDFVGHYYAMDYKGWRFLLEKNSFKVNKMYVNGLLTGNVIILRMLQPFFRLLKLDPWFICTK